MDILDAYVKSVPSIQNSLNIFKGEWASRLPGELSNLDAGQSLLFQDPRVAWAIEQFGGVENKNILELGPLEGAHTYMLEQQGADSITAVEANTRAYLKCLIVKEVMKIKRAQFLCGDFVEYLLTNPGKFDICFASGVLYHMQNPVELIYLMTKAADKIYLWTHYYNYEAIKDKPVSQQFSGTSGAEYEGFKHILHRYEYKDATKLAHFCGGSNPFCCWITRKDLMGCLKYFGFGNIKIQFDDHKHTNGSNISLVATRN